MRLPLFPSLASRIAAMLVAGQLLTIAATLSVFLSDSLRGSNWNQTATAMERIVLVAALADRLPAATRQSVMPSLDAEGIRFSWAVAATPPSLTSDLTTKHLARDLQELGRTKHLGQIATGYGRGAGVNAGVPFIHAWLQLGDGSWLAVVVDPNVVGALAFTRLVVALVVLAIGASGIALWISRKTARPLARFAAAAERLGSDIHAPPLDLAGPSEIKRAALAFNHMQERIERLVEDRTLILAAISHDLRTVLTRLALRVEAIDNAEQRAKGLADVAGMEAMLNASMTLARYAVSIEPQVPLDLAILLSSICDDFADLGHSTSYEGPEHARFVGRPVMLKRVFANVVQNAVTYGREASVRLAASPLGMEVSVVDRGEGIPPEQRERVFAPFFRVEASRNRESGGAGLGLAIVRSGVRQHGGDVVLEDRAGGGLCVKVWLPRLGAGGPPDSLDTRHLN